MPAPLKVYLDLMSQPCRAIYIILKVNKVPFEMVQVAIRKAEHLSDEFKQVNRFQKLPCIDDKGFKLSESIAILRYVAHVHKFDDHWYPNEVKARAQIDEYLEWQHNNTRAVGVAYFRTKWMYPIVLKKPADPKKVAELTKNLNACLNSIETLWLKNNKFIASNRISVADIFAACEIEQTRLAGYDPTQNRPVLKKWIDSVKSDTSPYYEEASKYLYSLIDRGVGPETINKL